MTERQRILLRLVCKEMNVEEDDVLYGGSRKKSIVVARHLTMYILKKHWGLSYAEVGNMFLSKGKKGIRTMDHSSVINAIRKMDNALEIGYDFIKIPYNQVLSFLQSTIEKEVAPTKILITINEDFNHEGLLKVLNTHYSKLKYEIR